MADSFNPYREWLGLADAPASHYELLGLSPGEADAAKITLAAEQAARKVRSFRPGANAASWSRVLDEIQAARQTLLDPEERATYDRTLAASSTPTKPVATSAKPKAVDKPQRVAPGGDDMYPPGVGPAPSSRAAAPGSDKRVRAEPKPAAAKQAAALSDLDPPPSRKAASQVRASAPTLAPAATADLLPPASALPPSAPFAAPIPADALPQSATMPAPSAGQGNGSTPTYAGAPVYGAGSLPQAPLAAAPASPQLPGGFPIQGAPMAANPMAPVPMPGTAAPQAPYAAPYPAAAPVGYPPAAYPAATPAYGAAAPYGGAMDPMAAYGMPQQAPTAALPGYAAAPMPLGAALPPASPVPGASAGMAQALPTSSSRSVALRARKNEARAMRNMLVGGASLVLLLAGSAAIYLLATGKGLPQLAKNESNPPPAAPPAPPTAGDLKPIERSAESRLVRSDNSPRKTESPSAVDGSPSSEPPTTWPMPLPGSEPSEEPVVDSGPAMPMPDPSSAAAPTPQPAPSPAPDPAPAPDPMPEPEPLPMVTRAEVAALARALTAAKLALGEMSFQEADSELAKAESLAKLPEHRKMVARLREVGDYVKQFRQALVDAAAGLAGGDVFTVGGSTQVAFVEGGRDRVILRVAGMNRTYTFSNMPAGLAVALADLKLDGSNPNNRVIKGAYLLVQKQPPADARSKAETWWEEAKLGGVDIDHLMPFLEDNYDQLVASLPE